MKMFYVVECPTEGVAPGKNPARVCGVFGGISKAGEYADHLNRNRGPLCVYEYRAMSRTKTENRYKLHA